MKILAYSYRPDETEFFESFGKKHNAEIAMCPDAPSLENARLADGCLCISIITTPIDAALMQAFYDVGVRYISTRTIGYEHIDTQRAGELGIAVGNVTYSPRTVADYAVMLMLMVLRKMKTIMSRSAVQDYALKAVRGREIHALTVGVIGTGRIGRTVIGNLSGFGCRVLAYDIRPDSTVKNAEYVPFETLIKESDIITLHAPAADGNAHLIGAETIAKMKDGVCVINTARGSLIDTKALIDAIESGKIGGAALDVIEEETALYYNDLKGEVITNRDLAILRSFPNVIVTPHTAFYTDQAVSDMVENSIISCVRFMSGADS